MVGNVGDVGGEARQRPRFVVGLPLALAVGIALEQPAGGRDFTVQIDEEIVHSDCDFKNWAAPLMTPPGPGEHMRARWIALPIEMYLHDRTPKAKPVAVQIEGGDEPIVIETLDGQVRARTGTVLRPDLVITGSPALALALLLGKASVTDAKT